MYFRAQFGLLAALAGCALLLSGCEGTTAATASSAALQIEPISLKSCPQPDPNRECAYDHAMAESDFAKALAGDYQAQRNISALHTTERPWIVKQPVQGCAWRMVIMVAAPADSPYDDEGMYRIQCGGLSADDLQAASTLAETVHTRVYGTELGPLPPIPAQ